MSSSNETGLLQNSVTPLLDTPVMPLCSFGGSCSFKKNSSDEFQEDVWAMEGSLCSKPDRVRTLRSYLDPLGGHEPVGKPCEYEVR